jgi:TRAP-type C4-dicarboxylate transport system permease small subunit
MESITKPVTGLCKLLNVIAGCALTAMMLLTVTDVILRSFRMPVVGTYELVAFLGGLVIGFAVPLTSLKKGHVLVDFMVMKMPHGLRAAFHVLTRLMGLMLFSLLGWNMMKMGLDMIRTGEVSLTLQLPFYPIAFGIGIACFVQCLVLLVQLVQVIGGTYD